jgi:hypothetical protein
VTSVEAGRPANSSSSWHPPSSSASSNGPTHSSSTSSIPPTSGLPRLQFPASLNNGGNLPRTSETSGTTANGAHLSSTDSRPLSTSNGNIANVKTIGNHLVSRESVDDVFPAPNRPMDVRRASADSRLVGSQQVEKLRQSTVDGRQDAKTCGQRLNASGDNGNGEHRRSVDNYNQTAVGYSSTSKNGADRRVHQLTSVSTACRAYSNLATACRDEDDEDDGRSWDFDDGRSDNGEDDDADNGGTRMNDCKSENRSAASSTVDEEERRRNSLIKFSSLPNIYHSKSLRRLRQHLGADAAGQSLRQQRTGAERACAPEARTTAESIGDSDIAGSEAPSTMSSASPKSTATTESSNVGAGVQTNGRRREDQLGRSSALFATSMPCISSACVARRTRSGVQKIFAVINRH